MRRLRITAALFTLAGGLALAPAAPAAPRDLAQAMPADTALYFGWSPGEPDEAEQRLVEKYLRAAQALAEEEGGSQTRAPLEAVVELLRMARAHPCGIGLFDVVLSDGQPDIQAALVVAAGAEAPRLADAIRKLLALGADATTFEPRPVGSAELMAGRVLDWPFTLLWGVHKDCCVLALGEAAAAKVIACLDGQAPALAGVDEVRFDRQKVKARPDGTHVDMYADVQRIVERGTALARELAGGLPALVDPLIEELGIRAVRSKYLYYERQADGPRMAIFAHVVGPRKGLLALWDQAPLTDDDLRIVPRNAYWAQVWNLDLAKAWQEARRVIEALAPDALTMVDGGLATASAMLGVPLIDGVLPALGDTWALFDAPDHGGLLLTGTVLVAEVRDVEALEAVLARIVQIATPLVEETEATLVKKEAMHGGHKVHYLLLAGVPAPVAPAWGFAGDRWVFGLFPQTVAAALKQVDPQTRGPSLLDHPDFAAARPKLPRTVQAVGYLDTRYLTRLLYPLVNALQMVGTSMLGAHGAELDLAVMPPVAELAGKMHTYVGVTAVDDDGVLYDTIGDGGQLALGGVAGAALGTMVVVPSFKRGEDAARSVVSAAKLQAIGVGCHVWAGDHQGKFPGSLDDLVSGSFITEDQLVSPRDPEGGVAYIYIAGQNTDSNPRNVLAYERVIDAEGTNVLFLDGHVEWMKLEPFKQALRETYRRLNRESEIPAEFQD